MVRRLLNRKNIIIGAILILFVVAIVVNITTNKAKKANSEAEGSSGSDRSVSVVTDTDYYTAFRENRDNVREKEIEYLESIVSDERADEETVKEASEQKLEIVKCMETELIVESAIKAKGFSDAAVTFHKGSVNVIVESSELTDSQVAQILEIVMRETGESAENIKLSIQR